MLRRGGKIVSVLLSGMLIAAVGLSDMKGTAAPRYMPQVTQEMISPAFWAQGVSDPNQLLADQASIAQINARMTQEEGCKMTDLRSAATSFDGDRLKTNLINASVNELADFADGSYFDAQGALVTAAHTDPVLANVMGMEGGASRDVLYGICTTRADVRAYPSLQIVTEEQGDIDSDEWQLSAMRVGEPALIKSISADRCFYYVTTDSVSGWVNVGSMALCTGRAEWLEAWDIPASEVLVVAADRFRLEKSATNPDVSETLLTMGTVLRKATEEEAASVIENRLSYHTYAAWLPLRKSDGFYTKKLVLIPQNRKVFEGYLPLTTNNILGVAFSSLGDTYGWGGGLSSADCSSYMRDVYRCFGLNLPRNTSWQAAMPTAKVKWEKDTPVEMKKAVLNTLEPGAILIFSGHEMMYLGHIGDTYYVISAVGTIRDFASDNKLQVRGVIINTLDVKRMSGHTWLDDLHTAAVPYRLN